MKEMIDSYKAEYRRTTGKEATVVYKHGWYNINNTGNVRKTAVEKALEVLKSRPTVTRRQELVNGVLTWIEAHQHVVQNLLSGKDVIEDRDTPNCCSVASETYWSM